MLKDHYQFPCPCCGKQIELDARTGKARAVKVDAGRDLDDLQAAQRRDRQRRGDAFDAARDHQRNEKQHLDDLFEDARRKARENPDEAIRRPFDLD